MAFNFPDPAVSTTATNPVTGAQYQWRADPGKWVLTGGPAEATNPPVTISLLPPEGPQKGDLWIHEESLVEYAWDGTQWFEVGSSCGGGSEEEEEEKDLYFPFVNSYKLVAPDDFNGDNGTATILTSAYDAGDDSYLSPDVKAVRFAILDLNDRFLEPALEGDSIQLTPENQKEGASNTLHGEYKVNAVTNEGASSTRYDVDTDFNRSVIYTEGDIVHYRISKSDPYVKKTGDTMTGTLVMESANLDFMISGESLKDNNGDPVLDSSGKEKWDDSIDRFSHIESLPPRILRSDGTYAGDTSGPFGIRVEIDDGNTHRNRFVVGNRSGDMVTCTGGTGPAVQFGSGFPGNQDKVAPGDEGKVRIKGIATPDFETAEGDVAVNKRYVDERDEVLRQGIIELEEEIDAIAPSVERGKWRFTAVGTVAQPGQFTMYDDEFGSGNPTGLFKSVKSIWFNEIDSEGTAHAFGDVDDGELLEVFVDGSPEFGLYEVKGQAHDETDGATSFWVVDVNFVRTNEDTTAVAPGELCRFKIFMAPTGGDSGSFVMKSGDEMSGKLEFINKDETGGKYNLVDSTSHLKFTTGNGSGDERSASIYQPGYLAALNTDCNLNVNGYVASSNGTFFGYSTNDTTITYWKPRVSFSANDTGGFYYGDSSSSNNRRVYIDSSYNYLNHGGHTCARWNSSGINLYYRGSNRIQVTSTGTQFYNPVFLDHNSTRLSLKKDLTASNNNGDSSYGTSGQVLTSNGSNKPPYWAAASGKVDITCSSSGKTKGDMWYCASDGVLYLKVS